MSRAITSTTQAMAWPRQGASDAEGRAIGNTTIPQAIQTAQCELALRLLSEDLTEDDGNKGVRVVEAGSVRLEYDGRAPAKTLPDTVRALLKPFLRPEEGSSARLVF
ncbi:DnaT-like ssDNA-binding protein [Magnetospirillum sp. 15-1]|uniref:DnaT-like ssDNA-binding protein n=1 Tax=Magnetospirillum sp. 15-1 TaxID=1979370 RepID=UPI001142FB7B|nr:DnaT-like ssDNA-binding protein [Magnetospirillum sp. 15-1]